MRWRRSCSGTEEGRSSADPHNGIGSEEFVHMTYEEEPGNMPVSLVEHVLPLTKRN
jgi:hypothetical protein